MTPAQTLLTLESFRLRNFKAVRDTGTLKFTPLTVLIGANGSGKSSLLEGLEIFHALGTSDVDAIFNETRWRGFHHVWNKAVKHALGPKKEQQRLYTNPMAFHAVINRLHIRRYDIQTEITQSEDSEVVICTEHVFRGDDEYRRNSNGNISRGKAERAKALEKLKFKKGVLYRSSAPNMSLLYRRLEPGVSILSTGLIKPFGDWQFLNLQAALIGQPTARLGGRSARSLEADGSNLAEVVRKLSTNGINRLVEGLQQVLGYARDLKADQFSPIDRTVYLKLKEKDFEVPGWLLSGGTVRIVAILACLYHDEPPPLLIIEEIENGLDPRTVGFLMNQMRDVVGEGKTQIVVTTHSPHFLSQSSLDHLLLCERNNEGEPRFWRPADSEELQKWSEDFNPGELFATGRLQKAMRKIINEK